VTALTKNTAAHMAAHTGREVHHRVNATRTAPVAATLFVNAEQKLGGAGMSAVGGAAGMATASWRLPVVVVATATSVLEAAPPS